MNRIEILVCTELFNIRKRKEYPRQVIIDVYKYINKLFAEPFCLLECYGSYSDFKKALKEKYISSSPIEYKYICDLFSYLDNFAFVQTKYREW